jgi:hypothetical protein
MLSSTAREHAFGDCPLAIAASRSESMTGLGPPARRSHHAAPFKRSVERLSEWGEISRRVSFST